MALFSLPNLEIQTKMQQGQQLSKPLEHKNQDKSFNFPFIFR